MENKLRRAIEIKKLLDSQKALYDELDMIIGSMARGETIRNYYLDGYYVTIVDAFSEKDVVWKPVALKRYELKVQTEEEFKYSQMSKSEKAAYTRAKTNHK